jgi:hypothetical protein
MVWAAEIGSNCGVSSKSVPLVVLSVKRDIGFADDVLISKFAQIIKFPVFPSRPLFLWRNTTP